MESSRSLNSFKSISLERKISISWANLAYVSVSVCLLIYTNNRMRCRNDLSLINKCKTTSKVVIVLWSQQNNNLRLYDAT